MFRLPAPILNLLIGNPLTSTVGTGLILVNIGTVLTMIGSGVPWGTILDDRHTQMLIAGIGGLFAKDGNMSGLKF